MQTCEFRSHSRFERYVILTSYASVSKQAIEHALESIATISTLKTWYLVCLNNASNTLASVF